MASQTSYTPVGQDRRGPDGSPEMQTHLGRTAKQRNCWTRWTDDGWLFEIASTLLGIIFVIALVVVLRDHDGQPAAPFSGLGTSLSLNTITAILSTAAKAALLYPVGACIGQLKWIWFSKGSRRLCDMTVFDSASRGILGGFQLIWKTKLGTFAALGALAMIYGIAIDPLSQQLVSYVTVPVPAAGNATTRIIQDWMDGGAQDGIVVSGAKVNGFLYNGISTGMKGAVQTALYSANETVQNIAPDCPSLNCTFPAYWSLAVCTAFADVTSHLVTVDATPDPDPHARPYILQSLSNTSYIASGPGFFNASSAAFDDSRSGSRDVSEQEPFLIFNNSIAFKDVPQPLADFFLIYAKEIVGEYTRPDGGIQAGHMTYGAVEVMMEWCVQEFTTDVVNGVAKSTRGAAIRNFTDSLDPSKNVGENSYHVWHYAHFATSRYLDLAFRGSVALSTDQMWYASTDIGTALFEPYDVWTRHSSDVDYSKSTLSDGLRGTNQTGLEHIINNVATAMTNFMRTSGTRQVALGNMYRDELLVKIRWKWIAAHVAFIVLCVLLLLVTLIATHFSVLRSYAWKSSTSAVLHALSQGLQQEGRGITTLSETTAFDREQLVRLYNVDDEGWRLVRLDGK